MPAGVLQPGVGRVGVWWCVSARWRVAAALAAPYGAMLVALRGLTRTLPTYHGGDEITYHLPTILGFAARWPAVDLVRYRAAQTPLFHLLAALWGRIAGLELWRLRFLEVVVSYLLVLVLYRLLRRHSGLAARPATAIAALFGLSPYVFGASFILVTDNLGLLLALLAIERLLDFGRDGRLAALAAAGAWIALALLTRQSYVWLVVLALAVLLAHRPLDLRRRLAGIALIVLAVLPFGALLLAWHGLVPPTGDPASCGLCAPQPGRLGWAHASPLRAPLFALAVAGVYGPLLHGRALLGGLRRAGLRSRQALVPALAAALGAGSLLLTPLLQGRGDEGYLWRVARWGPAPLGSAWLFWLLVPLGCAVLAVGVRREGARALPVLLLACFLATQLATRLPYQKYFDPFVLLACLLALRPEQVRRRRDAIGPVVVLLLSMGYLLAFAVGAILPES